MAGNEPDSKRTVLSDDDWEVFLATLDDPPEPTKALREMADLHKRLIEDDNGGFDRPAASY